MNETKKALAELKILAKSAADTLYRRIELSAQVLQDLDWIAREYGGSDLKAQDALQSEFFKELGGFIKLGTLIAMFRHVPKKKWIEVRYDIAAVEVIYHGLDKPSEGTKVPRHNWQEEAKVAQQELMKLKDAATRADERYQAATEKIESDQETLLRRNAELQQENGLLRIANAQLRTENVQLRSENAQLKTENAALRRNVGEVLSTAAC